MPQGAFTPDIKELRQHFDNLIQFTGVASGSTSLANGQDVAFTITTTSNAGGRMITTPDVTLYMDSVAEGNEFPGGSNVNMSQWVVSMFTNDWGSASPTYDNTKTIYYVRNVSAGTHTVILKTASRTIINSVSNLGSL